MVDRTLIREKVKRPRYLWRSAGAQVEHYVNRTSGGCALHKYVYYESQQEESDC